ncbi:MAG: CAP domain-containing protein [Deltaproteobacteria bacterium]|nr:CAP domain-containing protein [Deltaproteobacteria bacterium]
MTSTAKWALGLAVLLAALLPQPFAWGQLRTHSGATKSSLEHPKELEQRVFQFTNEARRKNGLPPLEPDKTLMTLARGKSDDMIKRHYFSHPDPEGKTIKDRYAEVKPAVGGLIGVGENISIGGKNGFEDTTTTARRIVDGFMVSPGHRKNILEPKYSYLGIGIAIKDKEYYVTQCFGVSFNKKP